MKADNTRAAEAWRLHAEEGLPWRQVAKRLGYSCGHSVQNCATAYARAKGLVPPTEPGGDTARQIKARQDGMSWAEIAERFGYESANIASAATLAAARYHGINLSRVGENGAEAYRLYPSLGTWTAVGEAMLLSESGAHHNARNYARRHNLPWPPVAGATPQEGEE